MLVLRESTRQKERSKEMPKAVWILIVGTFLNSIGSAFLWPLNSIYMHDYLFDRPLKGEIQEVET